MTFPVIETTNTTSGTSAATSHNVNLPSGIVAGNLLIVLCRAAVAGAIGWPGDWNELTEDSSDASDDVTAIAYKIADGTEGATISVSHGSGKFAAIAYRISGAVNAAPQLSSAVTGASTGPDSPNFTPTGGARDYLWLSLAAYEGEQSLTPTYPANYSLNQLTQGSGTASTVTTNVRVSGAGRQVNGSSENPGAYTISVSDDWTAWTLAVTPSNLLYGQAQAYITGHGFLYGQAQAYIKGTRFYLTSTETPTSFAPAYDAEWDKTSEAARHNLGLVPVNSPITAYSASENVATTPYDVAVAQFISPPLSGAQTISGPVRGIIQVRESNAAADYQAQIIIRVIASDASTVRGTLIAADTTALSNEFFVSGGTFRNVKFPKNYSGNGTTVTTVNAQDGDRIVIEVGFRSQNSSTSNFTAFYNFGDDTSYSLLAENETDTATAAPWGLPWIEFTGLYNFQSPTARASADAVQAIIQTTPAARATHDVLQVIQQPTPAARATHDVIQVLWAADAGPTTSYLFGQAQADILTTNYLFAQAQADILQTGYVFGQAQSDIKSLGLLYSQSQADIKAVGYLFGQAQANIKATGYQFGQAQGDIKAIGFLEAQAQASIARTSYLFAQAQADIKSVGYLFGQSNANIKATGFLFAQAQGDIKQISYLFGQAQGDILKTSFLFAQGQADIKSTGFLFAQAQADIKDTTSYLFAQANADIKATGYLFAQAQARIGSISYIFAQAQGDIKAVGNLFAQAQADIKDTTSYIFAQAQADILKTSILFAQAQAAISKLGFLYGQAQADIKSTGYIFGQAQADIKQTRNLFGQAQGYINVYRTILYAQTQGYIARQDIVIPAGSLVAAKYLVKFNDFTLPGYTQEELTDSTQNIANHQSIFADMSLSEYLGLNNKSYSLRMKVWENDYATTKMDIQRAAVFLRSKRDWAKLQVQYSDRYYLALTKTVSSQKEVGSSIKLRDYVAEFELRPWLISTSGYSIQGTGLISTTGRTYDDGFWTPATVQVTGTNVTISGYTQDGFQTGFMSINGSVTNMLINSENYEATIGGVNAIDKMLWANFALYVGPGITYFDIHGATSCVIQYQNRWPI